MILHDLAMTRFGQWWRRAIRAGHAYAEGADRHGQPPERHWVREARNVAFWGLALPAAAAALAWPTRGASLRWAWPTRCWAYGSPGGPGPAACRQPTPGSTP